MNGVPVASPDDLPEFIGADNENPYDSVGARSATLVALDIRVFGDSTYLKYFDLFEKHDRGREMHVAAYHYGPAQAVRLMATVLETLKRLGSLYLTRTLIRCLEDGSSQDHCVYDPPGAKQTLIINVYCSGFGPEDFRPIFERVAGTVVVAQPVGQRNLYGISQISHRAFVVDASHTATGDAPMQ